MARVEQRLPDQSGVDNQEPRERPSFISPMLVGEIPRGGLSALDLSRRVFQLKANGFRIIAAVTADPKGGPSNVRLFTRDGHVTSDYPKVASDLAQIRRDVVLDGEIEALVSRGAKIVARKRVDREVAVLYGQDVPNIGILRLKRRFVAKYDYRYRVFDIPFLDGKYLFNVPLIDSRLDTIDRRKMLERILPHEIGTVSAMPFFGPTDAKALVEAAKRFGLEGVVAKRPESGYMSGRKSNNWIKIKLSDFPQFAS